MRWEISSGVSDLLEKGWRDANILSVMPATEDVFLHFYEVQVGEIMLFDEKNEYSKQGLLKFYNKLMFITPKGEVKIYIRNGVRDKTLRTIADCHESELCDRDLLDQAMKLKVGGARFGRVLHWYSPEGVPEDPTDGSLNIVFRASNGIYLVGLDYRHLKDTLSVPTFPYQAKKNLLQAYTNGNYIFIVDSLNNIIIHPKYWDEAGIDKKTGKWVTPMQTDEDDGTHPINIAAYKGKKLKSYFDRLMTKSFTQNALDIFQALNLVGTIRVVSVVPIAFSRGQFEQEGLFGHALIGCNVDYFEEPKERFIPYY